MWTDKAGNKLTTKEFFARWKQGIQEITPYQQTKAQIPNFVCVLIGILIGIVISAKTGTWWLVIVLTGSLGISGVQFLGLLQKFVMLKQIEKDIREVQDEF